MRPATWSAARAQSSAYKPISAVMVPERMYEAMIDESKKIGTFGHGYTYSGHPVAAAVAVKTLEIYERENIVGKVNAVSPAFQSRLKALGDHPPVGEARGLGLIGALELVADKASKRAFDPVNGIGAKVAAAAEENGLMVRALGGDIIALCPPLIISEEEIGEMFDRLTRALEQVEALVSAENLRAA